MNRIFNKKHMKKFSLLAIIFIASIFNCTLIFAKNNVSKISMDVVIHDNGSASIKEIWTGTFDEGTEVYKPIEDKNLIVRNLNVWVNNQEYIPTDTWNVNWSFDQKTFRSGINRTTKGVELCFGISRYGKNTYTFTYDIDPLVKSYRESDGFNFQFVNPEMSTFPTEVNLRIELENGRQITEDNARIWGFGYNGEARFASGYAVAFTTSDMRNSNYMNVTLELFKGLINPNVRVDGTFEELVRDVALEDSAYKEALFYENQYREKSAFEIFMENLIFFLPILLFVFGFVATIVAAIKRKMDLKKFYKECNYFRDTPNAGNILVSHALFLDFDLWNSKESNVIGALVTKMINDGNLEPMQEKTYGFFGNEKVNTSLKIGKEPTDETLKELYQLIINAAGDDGILQENELKKYATKNADRLNNFLDSLKSKGQNILNKENAYTKLFSKNLNGLSDIGMKELSEVYGLRKFLDEFTLISERSVTEGVIWENLLIYATLFGIAKKVLKELKELYPDRIVEIEHYANTYYISDVYFRTLYYNAVRNAQAAKMATMAAKGFGGAASIGGGGGFSGGGHGGGTR